MGSQSRSRLGFLESAGQAFLASLMGEWSEVLHNAGRTTHFFSENLWALCWPAVIITVVLGSLTYFLSKIFYLLWMVVVYDGETSALLNIEGLGRGSAF